MIKLRDLITETVDGDVLRLSKEGASKPFLKDFDVGSYERVEKFFERIGFSPAKPGRPKK